MSQSRRPDDLDWRERPESDTSAASSCGILERHNAFVVPVIFPQTFSDVVAPVPHVVLACSPYDDDEDGDE